ncbi:MAG: VWA domain-containing protein [Candidatus Gracilibacteria bacterium]|nr:VWA domain-containing protein [Candidatus Gracilibacteria bacterium]
MNKIIYIIISLALIACDIPPPPPENNQVSMSGNSTGLNEIFNWPGEIKDGENIQISPDLFATNVLILIDTSGSMDSGCDGKEKFAEAIKASTDFLKLIPDGSNIGLINFGGNANLVTNLTNNKDQVLTGINSLSSGGGTPMSSALALANDVLSSQAKTQRGNGKYHIVILGDGAPDSKENTSKWLDFFIWKTPVQVHAIGFCAELDILQRQGMNYKTANNSTELQEEFKNVIAEIDIKADEQGLNLGESW